MLIGPGLWDVIFLKLEPKPDVKGEPVAAD